MNVCNVKSDARGRYFSQELLESKTEQKKSEYYT